MKASIADRIQAVLRRENLDGWLSKAFMATEPTKLVHAIESETLDTLSGEKKVYLPWQQLHIHLGDILAGSRRVAMRHSPLNPIPYISRVDA